MITPSPTANAQDVTATHTPGPWVCEHGADDFFFVAPVDGEFDRDQRDANARLIAAAPELLEALKGSIGALEQDLDAGKDSGDSDWEGIAYQRLEAARAAIAKVTAA